MAEKENSKKGKSGKSGKKGKSDKIGKENPSTNLTVVKSPAKNEKILEKTTTMIRYEFNEIELREKAQQLGEANKRLGTLHSELATIKKDYTKKMTETQCQVDELSDNVTQKYEMRQTPCFLHKNFPMKERQYLDHDGTLLKTEPLTSADYQLAIDESE